VSGFRMIVKNLGEEVWPIFKYHSSILCLGNCEKLSEYSTSGVKIEPRLSRIRNRMDDEVSRTGKEAVKVLPRHLFGRTKHITRLPRLAQGCLNPRLGFLYTVVTRYALTLNLPSL
jgi:hypothetical protein